MFRPDTVYTVKSALKNELSTLYNNYLYASDSHYE